MLPNAIPGLVRGTDPTIPKQVLEARLKTIDKRRAAIEAALGQGTDDSYKAQELRAEDHALAIMRAEADEILHPKPKPARHPAFEKAYARQREADKEFLRITIKQQIEQIEWNAQREESIGNHRQQSCCG